MHQTSIVQRKRKVLRRQRIARRVLPFLASLFLATPMAGPVTKSMAGGARSELRLPTVAFSPQAVFDQKLHATYTALGAEQEGLRFETFAKAMTGYLNLRQAGKLDESKQLLTVVDFDLPSTEKRLWVLDLAKNEILFHTLVAHGHNSGENEATNFSNTDQSNMSSLGFYATSGEYVGKHGRSLKLEGLDEGFNTNAEARSVVMHGADYVSEEFIKQNGRLGRSLGCPALPMELKDQIIETVTGGTCLFVNRSDAGYESRYLNEQVAIAALVPQATATHGLS
ncbi:murein L,D-transpeptidase catalytic domain family protein [Hymenobacter sp. 5317J-9]|uniref:murein L,D-transpeptidase catalytic domain family protein n=1 Tax=Hymenobacter sp. 5317J-9 TaxID=2932250 RepID=UPI001FD6D618|nr:murein L,D-transpeptidase catalytic domain family protein [Hymenobacter sp. 5317J-9]UOQ98862.1 murein L,D-transpeptidase catalytic domain family protein [Hymenobacter sp. 5317J-9]